MSYCRWQDDFLLSGTAIGPAGSNTTQRVWRITPADPSSFAPVPHQRQKGTGGNITVPVQLWLFDAARSCTLGFQVRARMRPPRTTAALPRMISDLLLLRCYTTDVL